MVKLSIHEQLAQKIQRQNEETKRHASDIFGLELGNINERFGKALEEINIDFIKPSPRNARIEFNKESLDVLANSIKEGGLLNPITVRKMGFNDYQIVAGERRYRACKQLGMSHIECIVVAVTDEEMDFAMLTENLVREKISTYEIAKGVIDFEKNYKSRKDFAKLLGISRAKLYRLLSYEKLPSSVLDRLDKVPSVLPDYAAEQITTLSKHGYSMEVLEPVIHSALNLVEEGKIEPSAVGAYVKSNAHTINLSKQETEKTIKSNLETKDGKTYGSVKKNKSGLTISLKAEFLDKEVEQNLMEFISNLLDNS